MLAITLGFTAPGATAAPVVLYAGRDATAADALSLAPPVGIIRTELIKHPQIVRRRAFPENIAPPLVLEESPKAAAAKSSKPPKEIED